ncbi:hypothetical protein ONZ45_g961 [Pleurotus djamor]|nr:hypothetical protein ONZ45_g961 [Pleurotus djamor]
MADETIIPPNCRCGNPAWRGVSKSEKNPGRAYWRCEMNLCRFYTFEDQLHKYPYTMMPLSSQQTSRSHTLSQRSQLIAGNPAPSTPLSKREAGSKQEDGTQYPLTPPPSGSSTKRHRDRSVSPESQTMNSDDDDDDRLPSKRPRSSRSTGSTPSPVTKSGSSQTKGKGRAPSPIDSDIDSDEDNPFFDDHSELLDLVGSFERRITELVDSNRAKDRQIKGLKKKVKELKLLLKIETLQTQLAGKSQ